MAQPRCRIATLRDRQPLEPGAALSDDLAGGQSLGEEDHLAGVEKGGVGEVGVAGDAGMSGPRGVVTLDSSDGATAWR